MSGVDIAILVTLGVFTLKGLFRGVVKELCSLVGIAAGSLLAFRLHPPLADWLVDLFDLPPQVCVIAAFLALFLVTVSFFTALGYLLSRSISALLLGGLNQVVGGCFGLVQGVILLSVVLFAASLRPMPGSLQQVADRSQLSPPFVELGEKVFAGTRQAVREFPR